MVGTQDPAPPASSVFRSTESAGPGLVFKSLPLAFAQMPLGAVWATVVFVLRFVAALTSAISLLEVSTSFAIDEWGVPRSAAALGAAALLFVIGIPSALSGTAGFFGAGLTGSTGRSWFDWLDHAASNWLLPIGGLAIAMFVSWRLDRQLRQPAFAMGTRLGRTALVYRGWLFLVRYLAPLGIVAVFLHGIGAIHATHCISGFEPFFSSRSAVSPVGGPAGNLTEGRRAVK